MLAGRADGGETKRELGRREDPARLELAARDRRVHEHGDDLDRVAALEDREPLGLEPPWRRGIEHGPAADGHLGAQDDTVAARCDDRPREAQLRVAAGARDTCGH